MPINEEDINGCNTVGQESNDITDGDEEEDSNFNVFRR